MSVFNWAFKILSYMRFLYILYINLLSDISFTNIFSHSESCLFFVVVEDFPYLCKKYEISMHIQKF